MQKTQWAMIGAAFAVVIAIVASAARAQEDGVPTESWASGIFIHQIERRMQITEAQREQIKTILKTEKPAIQSLAARVEEENQELTSQPVFDEARVRAFAQQHESTLEDVMVEREKVRTEILQVLTPEQQQMAQRLRELLRGRFDQRLQTLGDLL